jgi:hypothetical protein
LGDSIARRVILPRVPPSPAKEKGDVVIVLNIVGVINHPAPSIDQKTSSTSAGGLILPQVTTSASEMGGIVVILDVVGVINRPTPSIFVAHPVYQKSK